MATAEVTFTVPMSVTVTVDVPADLEDYEIEDYAAEHGWEAAQEFCQTLVGNHRDVRVSADLDGIGAERVEVGT